VAIVGKTSRRALGKNDAPLHLVSARASRERLVLGQEAVDEKSIKIVTIPLLLDGSNISARSSSSTPWAARGFAPAQIR
jgi:hypothetical protein